MAIKSTIAVCLNLIFCAYTQAQDMLPTVPKKRYADTVSFTIAPKRSTDKFPLSDQSNKKGWRLVQNVSDEFNAINLDTKKWHPNNPGWKGRVPTYFHSSNVSLQDGKLEIAVNKHGNETLPEGFTHSTGFIRSTESVLYGYFEAEMKLMDALWVSGFWLSNHEKHWWTEIDICENAPGVHGNAHDLNSNVHVFHSPADKGNVTKHFDKGKKYFLPIELQKDYHTWGLEWNEQWIRFYIDGILFREQENTHWHQPLYININCESNKWFGALPDGDNRTGEKFRVNYFRYWKEK